MLVVCFDVLFLVNVCVEIVAMHMNGDTVKNSHFLSSQKLESSSAFVQVPGTETLLPVSLA